MQDSKQEPTIILDINTKVRNLLDDGSIPKAPEVMESKSNGIS
jgi:hypothetical protein